MAFGFGYPSLVARLIHVLLGSGESAELLFRVRTYALRSEVLSSVNRSDRADLPDGFRSALTIDTVKNTCPIPSSKRFIPTWNSCMKRLSPFAVLMIKHR